MAKIAEADYRAENIGWFKKSEDPAKRAKEWFKILI